MRRNPARDWTARELAATTGLKFKTVQGTIFRLRHRGKVVKQPDGRTRGVGVRYRLV